MAGLKKIISLLLRVGISVLLLFLLFKFNHIDFGALIGIIKSCDKPLLAAGFFIYFFIYLLGFLRWKILLDAAGVKISLKKLISPFSGGAFFSVFLPSTIGGDLVRILDLADHTKKAQEVIATTLLDRLSGYTGLVFVILPGLFLGRGLVSDKVVFSSVSLILLFLLFILLVLFNNKIYSVSGKFLSTPGAEKIKEAVKSMHEKIHIFRDRKRALFLSLIMSFLIQLINPLSVYFIGLSLGIKIDIFYFMVFLPIIGAITLLPIAIGGLGLREGLFVLYFAKAAVEKQFALAMSLLSFFFVVSYGAIGGLIYVLTVHHRRLQSD